MDYLLDNFPLVLQLLVQHLALTLAALALALLVALPLGVLIARLPRLRAPVLGLLSVLYTIPSLALFVLLIPLLGLGPVPAVAALVIYAQFGLVGSWVTGLTSIDPGILESARGMGMDGWQRFWQVEVPLALPLLLAGVRLAVLTIIGIGAVAAFINAGGLGQLLFEGVITGNSQKILAGGLMVSLLALGANTLLRLVERRAERRVRE